MSELQVVKLRRLVPIKHCTTSSSSLSIEQTDTNNEDIELDSEPHPIINKERLEAQKLYYETHPVNPSPLMLARRLPVHERLGYRSSVRLKRVVPLGTNTSTILPKKRRLIRPNNIMENNANNPAQFRQNRVKRHLNLAQRRYENIRRANSQGPIRLKRLMKKSSNNSSAVQNFTVQVKNNNFIKPSEFIANHVQRFRMILDPEIQRQIQTLHEENHNGFNNDVIPSSLIEIVSRDNTSLSFNERFKMLSY